MTDIVERMRNIEQYDPCVHPSWCKEAAGAIESLRAVMWKDQDEIKRLRATLTHRRL
jgi:hypothetical protein